MMDLFAYSLLTWLLWTLVSWAWCRSRVCFYRAPVWDVAELWQQLVVKCDRTVMRQFSASVRMGSGHFRTIAVMHARLSQRHWLILLLSATFVQLQPSDVKSLWGCCLPKIVKIVCFLTELFQKEKGVGFFGHCYVIETGGGRKREGTHEFAFIFS